MSDITLQEMCETIAKGWTAIGHQGREWTGKEVFESDPNGELFWIPEQYAKSVAYLRFKIRPTIPCAVCGVRCSERGSRVCDDCKGEPDEVVTTKAPEVDETRCVHGWKLKLFCPDCPGERACR